MNGTSVESMMDLRSKLEADYADARWSQTTRDNVWSMSRNLGGYNGDLITAAYHHLAQAVQLGMGDAGTNPDRIPLPPPTSDPAGLPWLTAVVEGRSRGEIISSGMEKSVPWEVRQKVDCTVRSLTNPVYTVDPFRVRLTVSLPVTEASERWITSTYKREGALYIGGFDVHSAFKRDGRMVVSTLLPIMAIGGHDPHEVNRWVRNLRSEGYIP